MFMSLIALAPEKNPPPQKKYPSLLVSIASAMFCEVELISNGNEWMSLRKIRVFSFVSCQAKYIIDFEY
jgi:hypothetical protein